MLLQTDNRRLTRAEAVAVSLLAPLATLVIASYAIDLAGGRFMPGGMLGVAVVATAISAAGLGRRAVGVAGDGPLLAAVVIPICAWLLWLSRPHLLPLSTGPDLTHHLLLIHYIESHWRLVHDTGLERFLGEMAQYTPGSHVLAALAGAWSGTDGLRALHPVQAVTVALKAGFLFLIGVRLLPVGAPRGLAVAGVAVLLASPRYFLGGFTEYAFLAQVVAELFVVAMWWAVVAWDGEPSDVTLLVFGLAGAAAFLTWPVYVGPPSLAAFLVVAARTDLRLASRLRGLLVAFVPIALTAGVYVIGRLGWLQLAGTGGAAPWPSVAAYSPLLLALAGVGVVVAVVRRRGRPVVALACAVLAQAGAFYVLAQRAGASQPYMALKMGYLLLWPMAACATLVLGELWQLLARRLPSRARAGLAWTMVAAVLVPASAPLVQRPALAHPLPPAVSLPLYEAGRWARAHVPPACVEYLVGDDETAYWLHLAVLGNPRISGRTGDNSTFEPQDAIVRWLTPGGWPFAIADLAALPRDVRTELDVVEAFDGAAVVRRRGASSCDEAR
ncbi:MAG: hypothetical protein AB7H96_03285 [Vicinamibacterales bacterium]